jgi:cytoskeleton protein RodZ
MKPEQDSLSFGRYLQAIRLEKKISLEKVSSQTRIRRSNLLLIEQEDHENLPEEVFVKGFLRSYADAIGADGDEAVRRYESRLEVVQKIVVSDNFIGKSVPKMWWKLLMSIVLLLILVVLSIFGVAFFHNQADTNKPLEQKAPEEKAQPAVSRKHPQGNSGAMTGNAAVDKLLLKVTALENTWLKVIIDEKDSTEYSLSSGDNLDLEAHSGYNLLIGNSGGLKITLNDKPVPISGKSGEVVTIHLP